MVSGRTLGSGATSGAEGSELANTLGLGGKALGDARCRTRGDEEEQRVREQQQRDQRGQRRRRAQRGERGPPAAWRCTPFQCGACRGEGARAQGGVGWWNAKPGERVPSGVGVRHGGSSNRWRSARRPSRQRLAAVKVGTPVMRPTAA